MGINIPTKDELLINQIPKEELTNHLNADSVEYLSVQGLVQAVEMKRVIVNHLEDAVAKWDIGEREDEDKDKDIHCGDNVEKRENRDNEDGKIRNEKNGTGDNDPANPHSRNGVKTCPKSAGGHCTACLTGNYPVRPQVYADMF